MKKIIFILFLYINSMFSQELIPLTLQLTWKYQFQFAGYIMAKEKGFYKEKDLSVNLLEYEMGKDPIEQIKNGNAHFAIRRSDIILERLNKGTKILQLFALTQASAVMLQILNGNNINNLTDLKGKRFLYYDYPFIPASVSSMLQSVNLTIDDFKWVEATSYSILDLAKNAKSDLIIGYSTITPFHLKNGNLPSKFFHPKNFGFDFYGDILFTLEEFANKNPLVVKSFYDASLKGWEYAFANIEETIDIIKTKYDSQQLPRELLEYEAQEFKKLAFVKGIPFGNINAVKLEKIANTFKLLGQTKSNTTNFESFIYKPLDKVNDIQLTDEEEMFINENPVIKVGIKGNIKPIDFINDAGLHSGISNDLLKFISQKCGLRFTYLTIKEKEIQTALLNKNIDMYIDTKRNNNKQFTHSNTLFNLKNERFLKKHKQDIDDIYFVFNYDSIILKDIFDKNISMLSKEQKEGIKRQWIPKVVQTIDWTIIWQISSFLAFIIIILLYKNIQQKKSEKLRLTEQVNKKTKDLQFALEDKALLLKELNHRVKNNMQMIISLLRIQVDTLEDEKLKSILLTIQNRINAMSHLHMLLYKQDDITQIHTDEYFELVINDLKNGFNSNIDIKFNIQVDLDIDQAIYIGIILNELVTNAIKYAFKNDNGEIFLELKKENNRYLLSVIDNGIGLQNKPNSSSLGIILVKRLVQKQLKGNISFKSNKGLKVKIDWSSE